MYHQPRDQALILRRTASMLALIGTVAATCTLEFGCKRKPAAPPRSESAPSEPIASTDPNPEPQAQWQPQRPEFQRIADRFRESDNEYLGYGLIARWQEAVSREGISAEQRIAGHAQLAILHLQAGEVDKAISRISNALREMSQAQVRVELRAHVLRTKGIVYLRQAEIENCIGRHNRDCCIFPLQDGGLHTISSPAIEARHSIEAYLQLQPNDGDFGWLLNIIAMALGDYPDAVPERYRIPPGALESEFDVGRFEDIAPQLGLDTFNQCGGVIADDMDGDGFIDIVTSTFDPGGPLIYYRNRGDGGFDDLSAASRLDDQLGGLNCIGTDFDNDGDIDILILRGAWLLDEGQIRNSLVRNNGDGTFTDITRSAGLADPARPTQAAVWGDYDNDGDLDLYIANESRDEYDRVSYPAQLFRNNGDSRFTDIAVAAGVTNLRFGKGVTAGDYDNDGDLDIYVSNVGRNRLYRNNGDLTFTDVAPQLKLTRPDDRSFATWFFDYNNDGWLDLFVVAYDATNADIALDMLDQPYKATIPCLYMNNGDGSFTDVTKEVGLNHPYLPMGANFGDLDNDGWLDIYLATGDPGYRTLMPNVMLRNDHGRRFQNVTQSAGLGHLQKGHGIAFVDLDHDGDQDIYHQLGGFYPGDGFHNALFRNPGHGNHFIIIKLVGTKSNRLGVGARIKLVVQTDEGERSIHRAAGSVSSFGGSPSRQEIGLGDAVAIRQLEIFWPTSGVRQSFEDVPLDSMIRVTEDAIDFETVQLPRIELGRDDVP